MPLRGGPGDDAVLGQPLATAEGFLRLPARCVFSHLKAHFPLTYGSKSTLWGLFPVAFARVLGAHLTPKHPAAHVQV